MSRSPGPLDILGMSEKTLLNFLTSLGLFVPVIQCSYELSEPSETWLRRPKQGHHAGSKVLSAIETKQDFHVIPGLLQSTEMSGTGPVRLLLKLASAVVAFLDLRLD